MPQVRDTFGIAGYPKCDDSRGRVGCHFAPAALAIFGPAERLCKPAPIIFGQICSSFVAFELFKEHYSFMVSKNVVCALFRMILSFAMGSVGVLP